MKVKVLQFSLIVFIIVITISFIFDKFSSPEISELEIAVIPKGEQTTFWEAIRRGAESFQNDDEINGKKLKISWSPPPVDDDVDLQINELKNFIESNQSSTSGIVIAPLDRNKLYEPIIEAKQKSIPVVIMDSGLSGDVGKDFEAFVATNNFKAGQIAGQEFVNEVRDKYSNNEDLDKNLKVWILGFRVGSASTSLREKGFMEVIIDEFNNDQNIIYDTSHDGRPNVPAAKNVALKLIDDEESGIIESLNKKIPMGIFCPNETTTVGMLAALKERKIAGEIVFVGFDITPQLYAALLEKKINTLMVQDAEEIGKKSVEKLLEIINKDEKNIKEEIERNIEIDIQPVNIENFDTEAIKKLIKSYKIKLKKPQTE